MTQSATRWGASPDEWQHFINIGLARDLLPVVSNPNAPISQTSSIKSLGKTPSQYKGDRTVIGIKNWTERESTSQLVNKWKQEQDYGISLQCRHVRAFDCDINNPEISSRVLTFLQSRHTFPIRFREGSKKFLVPFYCDGILRKRVIYLTEDRSRDSDKIEFLGKGQQFIAAGAHIGSDGVSRSRYEWDWRDCYDFPTLSMEEFEPLWAELLAEFGCASFISNASQRKAQIPGAVIKTDDAVGVWLMQHPSFLGVDGDKIQFECPWSEHHNSDNGPSQTIYMLPGGRGYECGHFKCMHTSFCGDKKDPDFLEALGYNDTMFEPEPESLAGPGKEPAPRELPAFKRGNNNNIQASLKNLRLALARPDVARVELRTDTFRDEIMYAPYMHPGSWRPLKDTDYTNLRDWFEENGFDPIRREMMRDALHAHAEKHTFDSAKEWLTNEVPDWDGVRRCETFFTDTMRVEDTEYTRACARYLWSALAGRVLEPGIQADMVPILVGPQGYRKSSAVRAISPSPKFFVEIDLSDKEDNLARMQRGKLIAEIPELTGLYTREIEGIKKFIARQYESWVPKYQEFSTEYPRRLVFVGTTNQNEFLADDTGNRRWLPLVVTRIADIPYIIKNRLQLWAEARELFIAGGIDWTAERLAAPAHEKHTMTGLWEDEILRWLDTPDEVGELGKETPRGRGFFTMAQLMADALNIHANNCKKGDERKVGAILRKLGFEKDKYRDVRGWRRRDLDQIDL